MMIVVNSLITQIHSFLFFFWVEKSLGGFGVSHYQDQSKIRADPESFEHLHGFLHIVQQQNYHVDRENRTRELMRMQPTLYQLIIMELNSSSLP